MTPKPQANKTIDGLPKVWSWEDFNNIDGVSGMDTRRAGFLLFDFINMFYIVNFQIIQSSGDGRNERITIVYVAPHKYKDGEVEEKWYEYIKAWKGTH